MIAGEDLGTCLVSGAAGFLGRHFLAALADRGVPAVALVSPRSDTADLPGDPRVVRADLAPPDAPPPALPAIQSVIHLAARVHRMRDRVADPLAAFRAVNVDGTLRLSRAAAEAGARRFLLMSSVKAMGEERQGAFDESQPCRPASPYGVSKLEAERAIFDFAERRGIHAVALRLPMVYGPGNKGNMLRLLEAASRGRKLPLGRVRNRRSLLFVGNAVEAGLLARASDRGRGRVYLVADGPPRSSGELYAAICAAMGRPPLLRDVPPSILAAIGRVGGLAQRVLGRELPVNPDVVRRLTGDLEIDSGKIRRELGFEPPTDFAAGIRATVDWYLGSRGWPDLSAGPDRRARLPRKP